MIVEVLRHSYSGYYTSLPCWGRESDSPMPLKNMVTVAERFRRNTVDVVYVGSNPTSHPKIKVMEKTLRFF